MGTRLVGLLLAQRDQARVLTRDPRRAGHLPGEVETITGDVRDPASLAAAVHGCKAVVSAVHGFAGPDSASPEAIDRAGNRALIHAATDAGVKHFVLLSVHGAAADHPISLHRAKYTAEQELRRSNLEFTIIRPTAFLETWLKIIGGTLTTKGYALVFGPGRNPINFVSVRDVAALVALAVGDKALNGETVEIGGPQNLGFATLAERLVESSGTPGRIKHIPLPMLRAMSVLARPFAPMFARHAKAAVVMNTTDMTFDTSVRARFPVLPRTTLEDLFNLSLRA